MSSHRDEVCGFVMKTCATLKKPKRAVVRRGEGNFLRVKYLTFSFIHRCYIWWIHDHVEIVMGHN